jgi:ketosteroid isomerase-like protein
METDLRDLQTLMQRFGRSFLNADKAGLQSCITGDFEWHLHAGPDAPHGRIVRGVDAMLTVIRWRRGNWLDVRYQDVADTYTDHLVVQTFRILGADHHGSRFNCRGVHLYEVRDGLIARKDSFWKHIL